MESFLMPNPPVPAVPMAVQRLSKRGIPPSSKNPTHKTVSRIYSRYKMVADSLVLGTSLVTLGPGLSARRRLKLYPPLPMGTTASRNTRIPIPPSQWVKLRQNSIPRLSPSTLVRMEAPVVVKPEMTSNSAST